MGVLGGWAFSYERGTPVLAEALSKNMYPEPCCVGLMQTAFDNHPVVELRANLKSISHRCHFVGVACAWELTEETIHLPPLEGCLQGVWQCWGAYKSDNANVAQPESPKTPPLPPPGPGP